MIKYVMVRLVSCEKVNKKNKFDFDSFKIEGKKVSDGFEYNIYTSNGIKIGYSSKGKTLFKMNLSIFKSDSKNKELFRIEPKQKYNSRRFFEVYDSKNVEPIGYLKRKKPMPHKKDEWKIFDSEKNTIAKIKEHSLLRALLRRHAMKRIPFEFDVIKGDKIIGKMTDKVSFKNKEYNIRVENDPNKKLDRRLLISLIICLDILWF